MAFLRAENFLIGVTASWLRRHRAVVILISAVAAIGLAVAYNYWWSPRLEQRLVDLRFLLRGSEPASPKCVIVGINASSLDPANYDPKDVAGSEALQLMQQPFPWNRKVYALLLDRLFAGGAKAVVIDLLFVRAGPGDDELAAALHKYGDRVVIGSLFVTGQVDNLSRIAQVYQKPTQQLLAATPENITGSTEMPPDTDGVIRKTRYWTSEMNEMGYADNSHEIISMAALGVLKYAPGTRIPDGLQYINFQGHMMTYDYLPIEEVFMDRIFYKTPPYDYGKVFDGKLVFVGPVASFFHDTHYTPFGSMPGVELHAQIAASLLDGTTLAECPGWLGIALAIVLGAAAALVSLRVIHALALCGFLVAGFSAYFAVAQWFFGEQRTIIPMAMPLMAFAGTGILELALNFLIEQMERARIRSVLDCYVSKNVAELVLAERDQFERMLKGQKRYVTTLFSDIRGFTTMTESAEAPEEFVQQLNEYFHKMVDEVHATDGTLQQFVGDAIVAVWGNTHALDPATGAVRALRSAMAMKERLAELDAEWEHNPLRRPYHIGIGINHGEVIVGEIGHPQRREFTAIGDGINTAARLETATKQFGCTILVGEAVEQLTRDQFIFREVGRVKFKGKKKAIEVFTPLCAADGKAPDWLAAYHDAVRLYRNRDFPQAREAFAALQARLGPDDRLCAMYLARCVADIATPPGADWDDAWALTEK